MDGRTCCSGLLRGAEKGPSEQLSPGDTLGALGTLLEPWTRLGLKPALLCAFPFCGPINGPMAYACSMKFFVTFNSSKQHGGHTFFSLLYRWSVPAQRACLTGPRSHSKLVACANWYLLSELTQDKLCFYIKTNTASRSRVPNSH